MTQAKLRTFGAALSDVVTAYHYRAPENQAPGYAVWAEYAGAHVSADNSHAEAAFSIAVDYFTAEEFDAKIDAISALLDTFGSWVLESVQFEPETNIIHYEWRLDYA